jgi:hypothetical protein
MAKNLLLEGIEPSNFAYTSVLLISTTHYPTGPRERVMLKVLFFSSLIVSE